MILKIGSRGDSVKKVQQRLGLHPDGVYGPNTANHVKKFQESNGLSADGIIGERTWKRLFSESKSTNTNVPSEPKPIQQNVVVNSGPLNISNLRGHVPDKIIEEIPFIAQKFQINTPLRLAHFLAQCAHESMNFSKTQENLNYSKDGLKRVFPKYFPNNLAEQYQRQPEKIASRVYGGRMGNGPEPTKEGYKYRGRGYIQLTGKNNYVAFANDIGDNVVENPDLVSTKYPFISAAWFFSKNCLKKCDAGSSDIVVTNISKCVNGGTIGLHERIKEFKKLYKLLT